MVYGLTHGVVVVKLWVKLISYSMYIGLCDQ